MCRATLSTITTAITTRATTGLLQATGHPGASLAAQHLSAMSENRRLPRAARTFQTTLTTTVLAERAWSTKETTDKVDAQARIHELRCRLLDRGINAEPIGQCTDIGGGCTGTGPQFFPGKAGFCPREWVPV